MDVQVYTENDGVNYIMTLLRRLLYLSPSFIHHCNDLLFRRITSISIICAWYFDVYTEYTLNNRGHWKETKNKSPIIKRGPFQIQNVRLNKKQNLNFKCELS